MFNKIVYQQLNDQEQRELDVFLLSPFTLKTIDWHLSMFAQQMLNLDPSRPDFQAAFIVLQTQLRAWQEFHEHVKQLHLQKQKKG